MGNQACYYQCTFALPNAPVHLPIYWFPLANYSIQFLNISTNSSAWFFWLCNSLKFLQSKCTQWNLWIRRIWQTIRSENNGKQWKTMGQQQTRRHNDIRSSLSNAYTCTLPNTQYLISNTSYPIPINPKPVDHQKNSNFV